MFGIFRKKVEEVDIEALKIEYKKAKQDSDEAWDKYSPYSSLEDSDPVEYLLGGYAEVREEWLTLSRKMDQVRWKIEKLYKDGRLKKQEVST